MSQNDASLSGPKLSTETLLFLQFNSLLMRLHTNLNFKCDDVIVAELPAQNGIVVIDHHLGRRGNTLTALLATQAYLLLND
jgi:hypothetical protein